MAYKVCEALLGVYPLYRFNEIPMKLHEMSTTFEAR